MILTFIGVNKVHRLEREIEMEGEKEERREGKRDGLTDVDFKD